MLQWLSANIWTIVIILILAAVVCAAVASLVRNRKKGGSSCGCGCAHCAMNGACHDNQNPK